MSKMLTIATAAITLASAATPAAAYPAGVEPAIAREGEARLILAQYGGCYAGEYPRDCRERLRWERRHGYGYEWRDGRYYRRDRDNDTGAAIAGGIIGFALGAAIAGSQNDRRHYERYRGDRGWAARCRARYRSFDPASGTYLSSNGYRRYCRL
ncbi:MAG TPA: BA14K family protein [Phenylobacterium sp.]|nr:BA14K family protein [Phenylobacterium sp.]